MLHKQLHINKVQEIQIDDTQNDFALQSIIMMNKREIRNYLGISRK